MSDKKKNYYQLNKSIKQFKKLKTTYSVNLSEGSSFSKDYNEESESSAEYETASYINHENV